MCHLGCKPLTHFDTHEVEGSHDGWIGEVMEKWIDQRVVRMGMYIPGIVWGCFAIVATTLGLKFTI